MVILLGLEAGLGPGHPVQSHSPRKHGRRALGKIAGLSTSGLVRQPVPHQRLSQRAGSLLSELRKLHR